MVSCTLMMGVELTRFSFTRIHFQYVLDVLCCLNMSERIVLKLDSTNVLLSKFLLTSFICQKYNIRCFGRDHEMFREFLSDMIQNYQTIIRPTLINATETFSIRFEIDSGRTFRGYRIKINAWSVQSRLISARHLRKVSATNNSDSLTETYLELILV